MRVPLGLLLLWFAVIGAVSIPPTTGKYYVGLTQHVFDHITPNDPVAPNCTGTTLLLTFYYPTLQAPNTTRPYTDPITASLFEQAWSYPPGTIANLTTTLQNQSAVLPNGTVGHYNYPTVVFQPGGSGPPSGAYTILLSELASHGYVVATIDHPYEQPFLQYPYGGPGIYGLPVNFTLNSTCGAQLYDMRQRDMVAFLNFYQGLVYEFGAPFNTPHYVMLGHSLGGASAMGTLVAANSANASATYNVSVIAGLDLDGSLYGAPTSSDPAAADSHRPVMLMGNEAHVPGSDASWITFPLAQSGWWRELVVNGSAHLDFSDVTFWKGLAGCDGAKTPEVGPIDGWRMSQIVRDFTLAFLNCAVFSDEDVVLDGSSWMYPEVVFEGGKNGSG